MFDGENELKKFFFSRANTRTHKKRSEQKSVPNRINSFSGRFSEEEEEKKIHSAATHRAKHALTSTNRHTQIMNNNLKD